MKPDPVDELAAAAVAGAKFRDDPDALRARLAELQDVERTQAREEVLGAINENADAFNDAFDRRDPKVMAKVECALGAGSR